MIHWIISNEVGRLVDLLTILVDNFADDEDGKQSKWDHYQQGQS